MYAAREGNTVNVSPDLAMALAGQVNGYSINMHEMPGITWRVEGDSADQCVTQVMAICKREGRPLKSNAATFQRIGV